MLLDHHFYWKSNDKNKDGFSAHILPFGHNNETFAKSSGEPTINNMDAKLIRGRLFTAERAMKTSKEDKLLIVQNQKKVCIQVPRKIEITQDWNVKTSYESYG